MQYNIVNPPQNPNDTLPEHWFISDKITLPGLKINTQLFNSYASSGFNKVFANHVELNLFGQTIPFRLQGTVISTFREICDFLPEKREN